MIRKNKVNLSIRPDRKKRNQETGGTKESATGTYVIDKKTGSLVKVSNQIPGLSKSDGSGDFGEGSSNKDGDFRGSDGDMDLE